MQSRCELRQASATRLPGCGNRLGASYGRVMFVPRIAKETHPTLAPFQVHNHGASEPRM